MEAEEKGEVPASQEADRRGYPRFLLGETAVLSLLDRGSTMQCSVVEFSLGGCRLRTSERFFAGIQAGVEMIFKVRGIDLRLRGVTQWTDGQHLVGIRFVDLSSRRREALAEVLQEAEAEIAAKAEQQAAEARVAEEKAKGEAEMKEEEPIESAAIVELPQAKAEFLLQRMLYERKASAGMIPGKLSRRERRAQIRHKVDDSAMIFLINAGAALHGRIVDLSLGGCRIRTDSRFLVGIYTRVETEFHIDGLPFRLAGVIQAIHDPRQVGIRFLDMSERKSKQLEQLIDELLEMRRSGSARLREMQPKKLW
jgi:c-di-GMP-binding flagellar brake protein YcgR